MGHLRPRVSPILHFKGNRAPRLPPVRCRTHRQPPEAYESRPAYAAVWPAALSPCANPTGRQGVCRLPALVTDAPRNHQRGEPVGAESWRVRRDATRIA
jgi:hypothetical protein